MISCTLTITPQNINLKTGLNVNRIGVLSLTNCCHLWANQSLVIDMWTVLGNSPLVMDMMPFEYVDKISNFIIFERTVLIFLIPKSL